MDQDKKYFGNGRLSSDLADIAVEAQNWVNMRNMRVGSAGSLHARVGRNESVGSTVLLFSTLPTGTNICIGSVFDEDSQRIMWCNWNSLGDHGIYAYDIAEGVTYTVLLSADVEDGLNFTKYKLVHSCRVVNGHFYWTDNNSEPRRVNIDSGIKTYDSGYDTGAVPYDTPMSPYVLSWIRKNAALPLEVAKKQDFSFLNNFIADDAYQFTYRYIYRAYETSVLSVFSETIPYNTKQETIDEYKYVEIKIPFAEAIEQDVLQVDLVAKALNTNAHFIIKSWNKNNVEDAAAITDHNNGITQLQYNYYANKRGDDLDSAYSAKPFDSVPLLAGTLEFARNRAFFANYRIGYDTPQFIIGDEDNPSLVGTPQPGSSSPTPTGRWVKIVYNSGANTIYFVDIQGLDSGNGFYEPISQPAPPPFPTTEALVNFTFREDGPADFALYINSTYSGWIGGIQYTGDNITITGAPPVAGLAGQEVLKSASSYQIGLVFHDYADRKCGVITYDGAIVNVDERTYDQISYFTGINWSLDVSLALQQIPDWAAAYSLVITKCLRTRYFLQARIKNATYVTKDTDGAYVFTTSAYSATLNGCAFDYTLLDAAKMGYIFTEGDILKVWLDGGTTVYNLKIVAQQGIWLITELEDLGTLDSTTDALFEIYTPYRAVGSEPFFEVGEKYLITDAGLPTRNYSVAAGTFNGDVILLSRESADGDYLTENMSGNDKFYQNWFTDAARVNFVIDAGQTQKSGSYAYSNTYVQGTQINGLSSFEALNVGDVPSECGAISKLQLTSKVQNEQGVVMLAICENSRTVSMYIGEVQLVSSTGNAFVAGAAEVVGTKNVLKGDFGTVNPEGVVSRNGNVYWPDARSGKIIQYSTSGLFPISNYDITRATKLYFEQYIQMTPEQIEALGASNRPFIFLGIDPHHEELLVSVPKILAQPPNGYLPDFPAIPYPFDFYDGQQKAWVYKIKAEPNYWIGSYDITAENFVHAQNDLYAFKDGNLYICNSNNSVGNFFGVQYPSQIMGLCNIGPNRPKTFKNAAVEANFKPDFTYLRTETPFVQGSNILKNEWNDKEGQFYAYIKRNTLTPTATGLLSNGLISGETLRSIVLYMMFQWDVTTEAAEVRFANIGYQFSKGHST